MKPKSTNFEKLLALLAFTLFLIGGYLDKFKHISGFPVGFYLASAALVFFVGLRQKKRPPGDRDVVIVEVGLPPSIDDQFGNIGSWLIIAGGSAIIVAQIALPNALASSFFLLIPLCGTVLAGVALSIISAFRKFRR